MTEAERLVADYAGTGLTIGRHPMALRHDELATRGVMRACDLRSARQGRHVRVAGMVITRQRPGTAKGFVFLTLEDDGRDQHHRAPGSVCPRSTRHHRGAVPHRRWRAAESGRRHLGASRAGPRHPWRRREPPESRTSTSTRDFIKIFFLRFYPWWRSPAKSVIAPCILSAHRSPDLRTLRDVRLSARVCGTQTGMLRSDAPVRRNLNV